MKETAKNVTTCTVCGRPDVGVVENWSRWQAGQARQWRVTRHRSNKDLRRGVPNTICTGTGIHVDAALIRERENA